MVKNWFAAICTVTLIYAVSSLNMGGDFFASIEKIDNLPEISREYADWHLFVRRINKRDRILDGYYNVKKPIVGPKAVLESYILSNNKYYKMMINELVPTDLCTEQVKKNFIAPYFEGNSTYATPSDCVIHPGFMKMKQNQNRNFDVLAHNVMNKTIYGTYKLSGKIINKDKKVVGGAVWVVSFKKRE